MMENFINPIILKLGPFEIRWYGVLIMAGVALGAYFATRLARKRGLNPDHVWNALIVAVIFAIIGARLYHVFSTPADCPPDATVACGWPYYKHHFLEAFNPLGGGFHGLGIYGAIAGGIFGVVVYAWINKLNALVWLDLGAVGLAFGQFVGRWGNFINQELYGPPTGSSWFGVRINPNLPHQPPPNGRYDLLYHPTFLYESLWCLFVFVVLYNVHSRLKDYLRDGDVLLGYLILYPLGRFFIEMFRPDAWRIGGLATAQWIAIIAMLLGIAGLIVNHVVRKPVPPVGEPPAEPPAESQSAA
jgi:phosphatidylglycerol:prolipoprotein diacylglycerol transferase